ncbi:3-oxoacyl-ACP synthase [Ureibacillus acetophenoni]|uniref:3-oxoacyl-[acyl-carrier-protein] synthase-3 n=1 Tax=Ureibacillus acetophenoni TaxID=614649 RepID=A0A285UIZ2_9BACL|nr:3-oxoacyl-ACP synthase [Ureibacillus acetophenoni]SOC41850.1 3-oxoacyl-[acyl-carrier-protein] synthase-3 [Ureibacillus acetophenoni]
MIGVEQTSIYEPEIIVRAKDLEQLTGIPENVIYDKFGLTEKRIAPESVHASDLAVLAAKNILKTVDPKSIDVVIYFGSPYKDYQVWTASSKIQYELETTNAYAFELMNVSSSFPIALKVAKDMLVSDNSIQNILLVGGSKESQLINYDNPRSRFMFNFADGGAAALVTRNATKSRILDSFVMTDGSFSKDVLVPGGGSVHPVSEEVVKEKMHYLDVPDPLSMKERLDPVSMPNFIKVITKSIEKSGKKLEDIKMLLPLHTKRSMYLELLTSLGLTEEQSIYLHQYGHMSSLDPCYGLFLAEKEQQLQKGDIIVTVSAGTGYTWAATVIEWLKE